MVHTTDPWEKLISLCIMLLEMSGDAVGLSRVNSIVCDCVMFTWSWFQEKTHFNTLVYDINLKFGGVNIPGTNSDQMNQMRSEVLRTCGNFHYFRVSVHFLRLLHPDLQSLPQIPSRRFQKLMGLVQGRWAMANQGVGLQAVLTLHLRSTHILKRPKGSPCF